MAKQLIQLLEQQFPDAVLESHAQHGDETVVVDAASWQAVARFLRDDPRAAMDYFVDLTAVDYPEREPRFEVVLHLASLTRGHRLRLKARVGDADANGAEIETLTELWAAASWAERECWDMLGVTFTGHPDLRRILMYPEFIGHPLRKDYPAERIQPLVAYRELDGIEKIEPFGLDEGMSFGRQTHDRMGRRDADEEAPS
jgi:NADH-quinone oxidoreductase subunit C